MGYKSLQQWKDLPDLISLGFIAALVCGSRHSLECLSFLVFTMDELSMLFLTELASLPSGCLGEPTMAGKAREGSEKYK